MLTRRPLGGSAGRTLLIVVAVFGAAHVVFGLSTSFPLSLAALVVAGFADMFSMNIRSMIVALATSDELRGRVNAVEMVFISASNELGAFESGVAAALIGAVPAVVIGGAVTIGVAASGGGCSRRSATSTGSRSCSRTTELDRAAPRGHRPGNDALAAVVAATAVATAAYRHSPLLSLMTRRWMVHATLTRR